MHKFWKLSLSLFTVLLLSLNSNATEVDYGIRFALTHQDNVNLDPVLVESELSEAIRARVSINEDAANFNANFDASLESINYKDDKAPNENNGRLSAEMLWVIKPNQFEWYLSDKYTQSAIDIFDALSPSNKQNINAFTTGPNYLIRFNKKNTIGLDARLSNNSFEKNTNNTRLSGTTKWLYGVNTNLNVGLNFTVEQTNFEDEVINSNNDRGDLFFLLNYKKNLNTLDLEAGTTTVNNENRSDVNVSRYNFSFQNQRTQTSSIRMVYANFLSDAGGELINAEELGSLENGTLIVISNDTFVKEDFRFIYNKNTSYGDFKLTVRKTYNDYTIQKNLDNEQEALNLSSIFNFTQRSTVELRANYIETYFDDVSVDRSDEDIKYSLFYKFRAKRYYNIRFEAVSLERDSSDAAENYNDLKLMIAIEYVSR